MSSLKFTVPKIPRGSRRTSSPQRPQTSQFTDATRSGVEYCPYCGGYHDTDAERSVCARLHSSADELYRCPRCGTYHSTLDAAEHCCDAEKRYERKYDPTTYASYAGGDGYSGGYDAGYSTGYSHGVANETSSWYLNGGTSAPSGGSGESIFNSIFDFGGSKEAKQSSNPSDGIFDSYFNAGGGNNKKGGGFFG